MTERPNDLSTFNIQYSIDHEAMAEAATTASTSFHLDVNNEDDDSDQPNVLIKNVHLPYANREAERQLVVVACRAGRVWKISEVEEYASPLDSTIWQEVDGKEGLLIPS